jgi:hypothetical protein
MNDPSSMKRMLFYPAGLRRIAQKSRFYYTMGDEDPNVTVNEGSVKE